MKTNKILSIFLAFLVLSLPVLGFGSTSIDAEKKYTEDSKVVILDDNLLTNERSTYNLEFYEANDRVRVKGKILVNGKIDGKNQRLEIKDLKAVSSLRHNKVGRVMLKEGKSFIVTESVGSETTFENLITKNNAVVYVEAKVIRYPSDKRVSKQILKIVYNKLDDSLFVYEENGNLLLKIADPSLIILDTTPPEISIDSPQEGSIFKPVDEFQAGRLYYDPKYDYLIRLLSFNEVEDTWDFTYGDNLEELKEEINTFTISDEYVRETFVPISDINEYVTKDGVLKDREEISLS